MSKLVKLAAALSLLSAVPAYAADRTPEQVVKDHVASMKTANVDAVMADYADDTVVITLPAWSRARRRPMRRASIPARRMRERCSSCSPARAASTASARWKQWSSRWAVTSPCCAGCSSAVRRSRYRASTCSSCATTRSWCRTSFWTRRSRNWRIARRPPTGHCAISHRIVSARRPSPRSSNSLVRPRRPRRRALRPPDRGIWLGAISEGIGHWTRLSGGR